MNAQNQFQRVFRFHPSGQQVRTLLLENEPWFVAKDVCEILNHSNHKKAVTILDPEEVTKGYPLSQGGRQKTILVNESGIYHLIFRSNLPKAKEFRRWVTREVLPAIRQQGYFTQHPLQGNPSIFGEVARKVPTMRLAGRDLYDYREAQRLLGYSTRSSLQNVRRRFSSQLIVVNGRSYVTEAYLRVMVARSVARGQAEFATGAPALPAARITHPYALSQYQGQ